MRVETLDKFNIGWKIGEKFQGTEPDYGLSNYLKLFTQVIGDVQTDRAV